MFFVTIFFYLFALAIAIIMFIVNFLSWLALVPFGKQEEIVHRINIAWARIYVFIHPLWKFSLVKKAEIPSDKQLVIISNHQSMLDIVVLFLLNRPFKWVSKSSNFKFPLIGWSMCLAGYLKLKRNSMTGIKEMMARSVMELSRGTSLLIFPEGARSLDGNMGKFKTGAFKLALDQEVDILPVVVKGTYQAAPKGSFILYPADLSITILPLISHEQVKDKSPEEVAMIAREQVNKEFNAPQPLLK